MYDEIKNIFHFNNNLLEAILDAINAKVAAEGSVNGAIFELCLG